jgi:dolichol-phosphate mannosyltransferase
MRFISFAMVGGIGVFVHTAVLTLLFKILTTSFVTAQIAATFTAITSNFLLNNALTYRDQRLKGINFFSGGSVLT